MRTTSSMADTSTPARLTANDFFVGLFAALREQGQTEFSIRDDRFDAAIKDLYDWFATRASDENVKLRFRVELHPMYGDSGTVRQALSAAAQRQIISFDNPEYLDIRIQIERPEAERILSGLPVREELFAELAERFADTYRESRPLPRV